MRSLEFDPSAFEDLSWWVQHDRKKALRLIRLIQETHADPFSGIGKLNHFATSWPVAGQGELTTNIDWYIRFSKTKSESWRVAITTSSRFLNRSLLKTR